LRVIAVYSIKGGVGKTSTAVNLAYLSARAGARTLLWDLDPQAAASYCFRLHPRRRGGLKKMISGRRPLERYVLGSDFEGLDLLPGDLKQRKLDLVLHESRKPLKRLARIIRPLARDYDHVYIDCAPSISLVSEGVFHAADTLLVPVIPTPLSFRTLEQLRRHLDDHGPTKLDVKPFFCMVDRRKSMHRQTAALDAAHGYPFLSTRIPYSSLVESMSARRAPLPSFAPRSEPARAYEDLWGELLRSSGSWVTG